MSKLMDNKTSKIPTIIIDTREQEPYSFPLGSCSAIRRKLESGDYSVEGMENLVAVERKSINDFVSTLIPPKRRFYAELERLAMMKSACVVVEASWPDIWARKYTSNAHPESVWGATMNIISRYNIPVYMCGTRQIACKFTIDFLVNFWRANHKKG